MAKKKTIKDVILAIDEAVDAMDEALKAAKELGDDYDDSTKMTVARAIGHMRRGEAVDAITILEREFFPRWADRNECEKAYRGALKGAA